MVDATCILTAQQSAMKINRMAYEIVENTLQEKKIILAAIPDRGVDIAQKLKAIIEQISSLQVHIISIEIDKQNPIDARIDPSFDPNNQYIILVDDVADSGRTAMYALKPFLNALPKKIQLAVLVDRKHKKFPVTSDYIGIQVSSSLQENIRVDIDKKGHIQAFIN
ncbi:MAG: phosphoribosyltransferase family protein [Chitinophagaceae bacterium]